MITGLHALNKRDNGRSRCPSIGGEGVSGATEPLEGNTERNKLWGVWGAQKKRGSCTNELKERKSEEVKVEVHFKLFNIGHSR